MRSRVRARSDFVRATSLSFFAFIALACASQHAEAGSGLSGNGQTQTDTGSTGGGFGTLSDLISRLTGGVSAPVRRPKRPRATDQTGQPARAPVATAARPTGPDPRTRFVVGVTKSVDFQVFALTNPNRVILDMPTVGMRLPPQSGRPVGVITAFRGGNAGSSRSRVIIDVSEPVVVDNAVLQRHPETGANEIVVDILPVKAKRARELTRAKLRSAAMGLGATRHLTGRSRTGLQPPLPRAAQAPADLRAKKFKPLIVIDPGHGGKDSGAVKWGTVEKDVVLKFSLVLRDKLRATGRYRVLMTRATDKFIPLGERRRIAERNKAALFIAVHADYARSGARGATIFSLRDRVASRLRRSAKRSVTKSVLSAKEARQIRKARGDVSAVRNILADLAGRDVEATKRKTDLFAGAVIKTMSATTKMRRRPDKEAAFKVLKTQKVPSVLIELAFVSNKHDAALLRSQKWRNKVSQSITSAVDNYFSHSIARLPL
ncbi:MAG: N-acetylmuramoyl-L-alanine amidase [Pseudomonadota bacterium]